MELLNLEPPRKHLKSFHITNYYHKNPDGISTAYDRLREEANRDRRFVRLIVPGPENAQEEIGEYGRIYYVKTRPAPVFDKRYRLLLPFRYLKSETPVRKILEAEMPEIIEIGEKYTFSLLARMIRKSYFKALNRSMLVHFSCDLMDDNLRAFVSGARPFRRLAGKTRPTNFSRFAIKCMKISLAAANFPFTKRKRKELISPGK